LIIYEESNSLLSFTYFHHEISFQDTSCSRIVSWYLLWYRIIYCRNNCLVMGILCYFGQLYENLLSLIWSKFNWSIHWTLTRIYRCFCRMIYRYAVDSIFSEKVQINQRILRIQRLHPSVGFFLFFPPGWSYIIQKYIHNGGLKNDFFIKK